MLKCCVCVYVPCAVVRYTNMQHFACFAYYSCSCNMHNTSCFCTPQAVACKRNSKVCSLALCSFVCVNLLYFVKRKHKLPSMCCCFVLVCKHYSTHAQCVNPCVPASLH